ncbi:diaminopimelate epimerase [Clostridium tepidiprofundi DSM 19306]|uniref:Diaminopimelate epimerase n=1 Tax=Clostridium tepidiprofundi DSM 19306 TaxID=1121338 RepID=A0A151B4G3_9CLOT|nr:diaminopimelate epimerase [Clostridium tepidiprofundi]KYH34652.1 diaminopimelate epimerase [Clostridium tepidiprofundi DSM 19306]
MIIEILKCHGSGNDFLLIDEYNKQYNFSEENRKKLAIKLCDRNNGVGADGILFFCKSNECDAKMRIFNADGSEAEMCGNGLRCVGRYVSEMLSRNVVKIETMYEQYEVKYLSSFYENIKGVKVKINNISSDTRNIPINTSQKQFLFNKILDFSDKLAFSSISVSNPHLIAIVDNIDVNKLEEIGVKTNNSSILFPRGINVSFVKILNENSIYVKTYERGVGLTKSCGTGMMASSTVVCINEPCRFERTLNVYNDGGMIKCKITKEKESVFSAEFSGNATYMFKGKVEIDFQNFDDFSFTLQHNFDNENEEYDKFLKYTNMSIS